MGNDKVGCFLGHSVNYFYAVANTGVLYLLGEFVDVTLVHFVLFCL